MTASSPGPEEAPRRLRRAEAVLRKRTHRLLLVLERCEDNLNYQAVLRTAECFGVQRVWLVATEPGRPHPHNNTITKGSWRWLTVRHIESPVAALAALREEGWTVWATDLHPGAELVTPESLGPIPDKLALVMGRETDGVSPRMLEEADRRLYLPVHGFSESFNLNVATALMLQRLFDACPEMRGDLPDEEQRALRATWYARLARSNAPRAEHQRWIDQPPEPLEDNRVEERFREPRMSSRRQRKRTRKELGQ